MMRNVRTLLYFGSFNPVHNGHTGIAKYVIEKGLCDELWFVVSPRNPLKPADMLATDRDRLRMMELAVKEELGGMPAEISDIEFGLPRPSYTIDTLRVLEKTHPSNSFSLLVGADIIPELPRWKGYELLLNDYRFYVYPREGYDLGDGGQNINYLNDAPVFEYSSTDVREAVEQGRDISAMVAPGVKDYILEMKLWT